LDEHEWIYVMVDACYGKARNKDRTPNRAVLVVSGVNDDGRREILTWRVADVESADTWGEVFRELRHRGVKGVRWITSDGHQGIQAAARSHYPEASWQRCWTHFMRNALAKVGHKYKDALARELSAARRFEDKRICLAEAERVAERWEGKYPLLAQQIRDQFEQTLTVHGLPPEHRRRVYTTNVMERVMREIKRRINVVAIFPNDAALDRLVGAHLIERHETWQSERARYLSMEHVKRHEDPDVPLSEG
jgi:transposase-like protein